jgi:hypothetical protein
MTASPHHSLRRGVFLQHCCSKKAIRSTAPTCRKWQRVDVLGPKRIRFVFKRAGNPLLILRLGELPVLPQHYWANARLQGHHLRATAGQRSLSHHQVTTGPATGVRTRQELVGRQTCRSTAANTILTGSTWSSTATAMWRSRPSRPANSTFISSTRPKTGPMATTSRRCAGAK